MAIKLLTKKKQKWVGQFKPTATIRGIPLISNFAAQKKYEQRINGLVKKMKDDTERQLKALFTSETAAQYYGQDESLSSQARILTTALTKKWEKLFNNAALPITEQMVNEQAKLSKTTLHSSLKEMSGGLSIKTNLLGDDIMETIKASVTQSTDLIKSIPSQYMERVVGSVMRSITSPTQGGLKNLFRDLKKYGQQSDRRVKNLARDQTRKVYNTINVARAKKVGITKAEWIHSGGGNEPRKTHQAFNGKVFDLDKGMYDSEVQEWVLPGQLPNCGCTFSPIIEFDDGEEVA